MHKCPECLCPYAQSGNPQTGDGLAGLAVPATVHETLANVSPEAEDAHIPGGGSGEDNIDPFRDFFFRMMDDPEDPTSEHDSDSDALTISSDDEPLAINSHRLISTKTTKPCLRPGINVTSLNMRGHQKGNKDKLKMVIDWQHTNKIAILAIQETHLMEESIKELNDKYRHLKFFRSGLSTSSTGILFIISDRAGTPQEINFTEIEKGRSGVLYCRYSSQILNIVNVYMPNHKTQNTTKRSANKSKT